MTPSSAIIEPTDSSMPPVMMTKPCGDGEDAEKADEVGGIGDVDRRQEPRVDDRDHRADDDDQHQEPEVFLIQHSSPAIIPNSAIDGRHRTPVLP